MQARLIPAEGDGATVDLVKEMILVGRTDDCDVIIDHKSVSKLHCILVKTDGLILVRDLGSTNGTRVNGQRVRRAALLPNDYLSIANFKYSVHFGPDVEESQDSLDAVGATVPAGSGVVPVVMQRNLHPDVIPDASKN